MGGDFSRHLGANIAACVFALFTLCSIIYLQKVAGDFDFWSIVFSLAVFISLIMISYGSALVEEENENNDDENKMASYAVLITVGVIFLFVSVYYYSMYAYDLIGEARAAIIFNNTWERRLDLAELSNEDSFAAGARRFSEGLQAYFNPRTKTYEYEPGIYEKMWDKLNGLFRRSSNRLTFGSKRKTKTKTRSKKSLKGRSKSMGGASKGRVGRKKSGRKRSYYKRRR